MGGLRWAWWWCLLHLLQLLLLLMLHSADLYTDATLATCSCVLASQKTARNPALNCFYDWVNAAEAGRRISSRQQQQQQQKQKQAQKQKQTAEAAAGRSRGTSRSRNRQRSRRRINQQ